MTAEDKLAHQRLSVLELAERLGNVREACRQRGVSRTQFYGKPPLESDQTKVERIARIEARRAPHEDNTL